MESGCPKEWHKKKWLMLVYKDCMKTKGKLCMKTFSLFNMGEKAVKYHALGKK